MTGEAWRLELTGEERRKAILVRLSGLNQVAVRTALECLRELHVLDLVAGVGPRVEGTKPVVVNLNEAGVAVMDGALLQMRTLGQDLEGLSQSDGKEEELVGNYA